MRYLVLVALSLMAATCGGGSPTAPMVATTPAPAATPAPTPAPAATPTPAPTPAPGPLVLRSASMSGANGHSAGGTVEIVRNGSSHTLEFRSDFRIDGGMNDVYLANSTDRPRSGDLNLGELRSRSGAQSYVISGGDGSGYSHVLIWCRPFQVPIGLGRLR